MGSHNCISIKMKKKTITILSGGIIIKNQHYQNCNLSMVMTIYRVDVTG